MASTFAKKHTNYLVSHFRFPFIVFFLFYVIIVIFLSLLSFFALQLWTRALLRVVLKGDRLSTNPARR